MLLAVQVALVVVAATLELASASALGAVNTNLARSAGPAVAGLLVAHVGVAAVFGLNAVSFVVREHVGANRLLVLSGTVYGLALLVVATVANTFVVGLVLVAAGLAWMIQVSRMNASLQLFLPNWVRARGFAVYQVVFADGQALEAPSRT
jgi:hypothetical protein